MDEKLHYSRRNLLQLCLAGGAGLAALALAGCSDESDDDGASETGAGDDEMMADEMMDEDAAGSSMMDEPRHFSLIAGWYRGREVEYYDFGATTPLVSGNAVQTAPIYAFIRGMNADGSPNFVAGQANVVGVVPGDEGYSDLWQVFLVTVPDDYQANDVKDVSAMMAAGFAETETSMYVNCPIVPAGSTLEGGEQLVQGWHNGEEVFYPDFGPNPPAAIPIWAFVTGIDADGNPRFVEGQMNVIDSVPGDAGYSAFWRVNLVMVPESYAANSIKSAEEVRSSGYEVMQTDMLVNCPVVRA